MKIRYLGNLRTEITHETGDVIGTDAPKDNMGKGEKFCPTDLFAASLGACMLTLMGIAANKLRVDLGNMTAEVEKEMATQPRRRIGKIVVRVKSPFFPNKEQQRVLEEAALHCPVHESINPNIKLELDFVWGL